MHIRPALAGLILVCIWAAPAPVSATPSPSFDRAKARITVFPEPASPLGNTRVVISFVETGLAPGEVVDYLATVDAHATYVCRSWDGPDRRFTLESTAGFYLGTFAADGNGVVSGTGGIGEGDASGGIELIGRPGSCPTEDLVRTKIVYYNIAVTDATHEITREIPGRRTYARGLGR